MCKRGIKAFPKIAFGNFFWPHLIRKILYFCMSTIQKIFKFILPKKLFQNIEDESKKWFMICDKCGYSLSYWEAGGLRAFATKKKRIWGRCPNCKKYKFFNVIKKT